MKLTILSIFLALSTSGIELSVFADESGGADAGAATSCTEKIVNLQSEVSAAKALIDQFKRNLKTTSSEQCLKVKQTEARVGATCTSSSGVEFVRYRNPETGALGWLDTGDYGKIWYDPILSKKPTWQQADQFCDQQKGQMLPTKENFEFAQRHRFREIFEDMNSRLFWTSTSGSVATTHYSFVPMRSQGTAAFNITVDDGGVFGDSSAVRCVGQ